MRSTMKLIGTMLLMLAMLAAFMPALGLTENAYAEEEPESITVYFTINNKGIIAEDKDGNAVARVPVTVTDLNGDKQFSYDEALVAAHDQYYEGGAIAGYNAEHSVYEVWVAKLWGAKYNETIFQFYTNGTINSNTVDKVTVKDGDLLYASIDAGPYRDDHYWYTGERDLYTSFDDTKMISAKGINVKVHLEGNLSGIQIGFWEKGNFKPIEGAITDEKGEASVMFETPGDYLLTASGTVKRSVSVIDQNSELGDVETDCQIMAPYCVVTVVDHTHDDVTFQPWTNALAKEQNSEGKTASNSLPSSDGCYYLTEDVTISSAWEVPAGVTSLCLNGHGIKFNGTDIWSNKTLNLYDCDTSTKHSFTVSDGLATIDDTFNANNQTFTGGYITRGNNSSNGGGVRAYGTFNMYGGTIIGNNNGNNGGGVNVASGARFNMNGGSIMYNTASCSGGGVNTVDTFNMDEGSIENNTAGVDGGGVNIGMNGKLNMTGGLITENTANGSEGGGVWVSSGGLFTVSGAPKITRNTTKNATKNVFLASTSEITVNGSLKGEDDSKAIGVTMENPGVFTSGLADNLPEGKTAADIFTSDDEDYYVDTNSNEACLAKKTQETTPNATFEVIDNAGGTIKNLTAKAVYIISGAGLSTATDITATDEGTYKIGSGLTAGTLSIVKKGGAKTKDSAAQKINITQAAAPSNITVADCSASGLNDGKITVNTVVDNMTLEYKEENDASWTSITSGSKVIENLAPGKYYVRVKASGTQLASESSSAQVVKGVVATPEFSPAAGNYTEAKAVTITCGTENAKIYYTTDNTPPTSASTEYTGSITVSSTTTIKAIAIMDGMRDSDVATATYTITPPSPGPTPKPTPSQQTERDINNLPPLASITLADKDAVLEAVEEYNKLSPEDQKKIDPKLVDKLMKAYDKIQVPIVEDVAGKLPQEITLNDEAAVNTAVEAYLALTEAQKELFSPELKQRLANAEDVINKGKAAAITTKVSGAKNLKGGKVRMQLGNPHYNAAKGKAASGKPALSAQEVTGINGFYIQYSTDKKFKKKVKTKKIKNPKAKTVTIKHLKKGKSYYFRVCTYAKVTNRISGEEKTVKGKRSAKKKVKINK